MYFGKGQGKATIRQYCSLVFITATLFCAVGSARQASAQVTIPDGETINASGVNNIYGIHASSSYPASTDIIVGDNVSVDIAATNYTTGNPSAGLYATGAGASIGAGGGLTVNADGDYAYGIYAYSGGKINIGSSADIITSGSYAYGAYAFASTINIGQGATITTSGYGASGTYAYRSTMDIGQGATITTSGKYADGAYAYSISTMNIGEGATITTSGDYAHGATADGSSTMTIGKGAIITTSGGWAYGASASSHSTMDIGAGATITTSGNRAYGAYVGSYSSMDIGKGVTITASGEGSHGAYAFTSSSMDIGQGVTITASGEQAYGAYAEYESTINIGEEATITASGKYARGVSAYKGSTMTIGEGATITTSGYGATGASAYNGSTMTIGKGATITTSGDSANGAYVVNDGTMDIGEGATITTTGQGAHAVFANNLAAYTATSITLNGGTISATGKGACAIMAYSRSHVTGSGVFYITGDVVNYSSGVVALTMSGDSTITGDLVNENESGVLNVTMGDDSYVTGTAKSDGVTGGNIINIEGGAITAAAGNNTLEVTRGGTINLIGTTANADGGELIATASSGSVLASAATLTGGISNTGNGALNVTMNTDSVLTGAVRTSAAGATNLNMADSLWNVTGDSDFGGGQLINGGTVDYTASTGFATITVGDLGNGVTDGGTFIMKTNIVNLDSDKLYVSGATDGSYMINVRNDGSAATDGTELVQLVYTGDQNGSFALTNGTVDLGAWSYSLRRDTDNYSSGAAWELHATRLSDPGSDSINIFYAAYLLGYADTNTLIQRLGDLRQSPDESGFWFRGHGGKFKSNAKSFVQSFDMDYWGVQLGYDRNINIGWDGDAYLGVMFGYSKGDLDYLSTGNGNVESKMAGIYGTFIKPNGFYLDAILKYQWMDNDFNSLDSSGAAVTGSDVSTGGLGFSVEVGQRIPFGKKNSKGWYAEPQVQFTYQRYGDGYFTASNGLHIGLESYTSMIGRLGILIGYETENSNFYGKLFRNHEFDGDVMIVANGQPIAEDFGGSWWVYGLGYTARLNDRNSIYLDIERSNGGSFDLDWAVKAGWRIVF